ncbi:MAG: hypothetical protein ACK5YC_04740, partial [Planctomyces sp.]
MKKWLENSDCSDRDHTSFNTCSRVPALRFFYVQLPSAHGKLSTPLLCDPGDPRPSIALRKLLMHGLLQGLLLLLLIT